MITTITSKEIAIGTLGDENVKIDQNRLKRIVGGIWLKRDTQSREL